MPEDEMSEDAMSEDAMNARLRCATSYRCSAAGRYDGTWKVCAQLQAEELQAEE